MSGNRKKKWNKNITNKKPFCFGRKSRTVCIGLNLYAHVWVSGWFLRGWGWTEKNTLLTC